MKKERFLNIDIQGEENVGVISLGKLSHEEQPTDSEKCDHFKQVAKPKLKQALEEHFDADVEVKSFNVISVLPPIDIRCMISIEFDGEQRVQEITLNETWVY